jgi:catechol 2,3-dioxygenase-like lactoylglutathione lyase family enzyme
MDVTRRTQLVPGLLVKACILFLLLAPVALAQLPPGNEKGVSMGHIHLRTSDPDAHKKLWIDALGARVVKAGSLEFYQFPGVQIALLRSKPNAGTDGCVVDHLGFKVKSLAETKEKLTTAGAKVISENPKTQQMFVEFPDAIKIEFTEDKTQSEPVVHHHIHFAVQQIDEQRAWYTKIFGAVPGISAGFKAADVPGVNLRWKPADSKLAGTKGRAVDHIGFEIVNLEQFCKSLQADGVKLDLAYRSVPQLGLSIAFLTDPWGVNIELTEGLAKLK